MSEEDNKETTTKSTSASKVHDSGAADLEKVTDFAEEKEIGGSELNNAINAITDKHQREANEKAEKEQRLAKVKINNQDVDLIANEMELSKIRAERVLREQNGDPVAALRVLLNS